MGEISLGASFIIAAVVLNSLVAYFESQGATANGTALGGGCTTTNNATTCQNVSKTTFFSALAHVTVAGVQNAPDIFNVIYVILAGSAIVLGVILFGHGIIANIL